MKATLDQVNAAVSFAADMIAEGRPAAHAVRQASRYYHEDPAVVQAQLDATTQAAVDLEALEAREDAEFADEMLHEDYAWDC